MTCYLDHAATTDVIPEALAAYVRQAGHTGNASAIHAPGRLARKVVEDARAEVAAALGARPREVIFTASGTEADNLAIKGSYWARHEADPARNRIVISAVEHHAVSEAAQWLAAHEGAELVVLPVDAAGIVRLDALDRELAEHGERIAFVSVMWANHEVGAVQPIAEIVERAHRHGIPVHTDAVQAIGQLPINFAATGVDALTISGHKIGAPIGVGALLARRELALTPVLHGGGQERGVRSGTLDAPAIRAFAVAITAATSDLDARARHLRTMRDAIIAVVQETVPDAQLRGPAHDSTLLRGPAQSDSARDSTLLRGPARAGSMRLPANAHFTFPGCAADDLLFLLDQAGIAASAGAACQAGVVRPSEVLLAMGVPEDEARGAVRFSVGMSTRSEDIEILRKALPRVIATARAAS